MLFTKEHQDLMTAFERDTRGRIDKEDKNLWPRGNIYQDGHVNEAFKAYRKGYSFGKAVALADLREENDRMRSCLCAIYEEAQRGIETDYRRE